MHILNKLTIKHLKMNKKRTLVTIIGITLSCALMVGVGLLTSSLMESEKANEIKRNGSHHSIIYDLNEEEIKQVSANAKVKNTYFTSPIGFARKESVQSNKYYWYVNGANDSFFEKLTLKKGRIPQNSNEIIISDSILQNKNYEIGDMVTLDIGARVSEGEELDIGHDYSLGAIWNPDGSLSYVEETLNIKETKTYQIVGVFDGDVYEDYQGSGYLVFTKLAKPQEHSSLYVEYKKPSKAYDTASEIGKNLSNKTIEMNDSLLVYYGVTKYSNVNNVIIPLLTIALSVLGIGCAIVIYNSFAISTMERKKSFGLYASIGATNKQIKRTVLYEAFIVGVIGILLGLIGAFVGIYTVIQVLQYLLKDFVSVELQFYVNPVFVIIPLLISIFVIFISAYLPAKKASLITPIEAIRGNNDIKISRREVKCPKIISKIFGLEGTIAYKNIKRNKKKYRITIISLFISIVMFNTFTSFLSYIIKGTDSVDYTDSDIVLYFPTDKKEAIQQDMETILNHYKIEDKRVILDSKLITIQNLDKKDFTKEFYESFLQDEENISFLLLVLPYQDYREISNEQGVIINQKYLLDYSNQSRKLKEMNVLKKKEFDLSFKLYEEKSDISQIHVETSTKDYFGFKHTKYNEAPVLIISDSTYESLGGTKDYDASIYLNSKKYKEIYQDLKDKKLELKNNYTVVSPAIDQSHVKNAVLAIKILFYGFISLVTLIGVTSVLNTIYTSMNLRRKEFAMLRSVGLTPRGFNKMLALESVFFGLKSLFYGIPVSIGLNYLICSNFSEVMNTGMIINYSSLLASVIGVFVIVLIAVYYSSKKIKKENILEALREENI